MADRSQSLVGRCTFIRKRTGVPAAQLAAAELTALQDHPELRPTLSAPRWKTLPLAPFIAVLALALLLWSPFG